MKNLSLILIFSVAFFFSINAQFSVLFHGGINYGKTTQIGSDVQEIHRNQSIVGYFLAAAPNYQLTNLIQTGVEFQYSLEGYRTQSFGIDFSTHLHYIRVIPQVQLKVFRPLHFLIGANLGYLGSHTVKSPNVERTSIPSDFAHDKFDFGLLTGFNLNIKGVNLSLKYNYGLKSIDNISFGHQLPGPGAGIDLKNRFLQVGLGYRIDFKIL
jgi:hypothetical protein